MEPVRLNIYTDGACKLNGFEGNKGGWSYVVLTPEGEVLLTKRNTAPITDTTNNLMELEAVLQALKDVKYLYNASIVTIYTDSKNVIGWLNQGWNRNVLHIDKKVVEILEKMEGFEFVSFVRVKGHSGNPLNEMADKLAVEGCKL